jgi:hypothetical protein
MVQEQLCFAHRNAAGAYHQLHRDSDAAAVIHSAETGLGCPAAMFH